MVGVGVVGAVRVASHGLAGGRGSERALTVVFPPLPSPLAGQGRGWGGARSKAGREESTKVEIR